MCIHDYGHYIHVQLCVCVNVLMGLGMHTCLLCLCTHICTQGCARAYVCFSTKHAQKVDMVSVHMYNDVSEQVCVC